MKKIFYILWLPTLISLCSCLSCQSQPVSISFDHETLVFPITVKEATERYKLSFNSPGYYYRKDEGREMNISIAYQRGDYDNEYQPKEVLYDREVVSYVLKYDGTKINSDSVKLKVEQLCQCKLTFVTDTTSANPPSIAKFLPHRGIHYYGFASLNEDVIVGFRNKPSEKGEIIPEVRFFYKQPANLVRKGMRQY